MTRSAFVTRILKPSLYVAAVLPFAWMTFALFTGRVDGDEVKYMQHLTGTTALVTLFVTIAVTPLRRLSGWNEVVRVRRLVGLTAFWYALIHLLTYLVFDQSLSPGEIGRDIAKHPWVLVGFATFLILLPLAVTSTNGWVRRLGGKRWQRLHRLVYLAPVGGVLHYLWLVKKDVRTPIWFALALAALLLLRLYVARGAGRPAARRVRPAAPSEAA